MSFWKMLLVAESRKQKGKKVEPIFDNGARIYCVVIFEEAGMDFALDPKTTALVLIERNAGVLRCAQNDSF